MIEIFLTNVGEYTLLEILMIISIFIFIVVFLAYTFMYLVRIFVTGKRRGSLRKHYNNMLVVVLYTLACVLTCILINAFITIINI